MPPVLDPRRAGRRSLEVGRRIPRDGLRGSCLGGMLVATLLLCALASPLCAAAGEVAWRFAPALAPPPPPGVQAAPYPVALGPVGDIEFWAPNRGVLITAGNREGTPVPMGVYAYDGVSWHQLSTVCGGSHGRIAWAGPDEFWTIADQRAGQAVANGSGALLQDVSLCHFLDGQVVGSYATQLGQVNSYLTMDAAACTSPSNCWFGGVLGQYPNSGSFHLHWDGQNVTIVYDTSARDDHAIASIADYAGTLYEGVQLTRPDEYGGETPQQTPIVHTISPSGSFGDVPLADVPSCSGICPSLPEYHGLDPTTLAGFQLSSDAGLGAGGSSPRQLWAAVGRSTETFGDSETIHPLLLRCGNDDSFGEGPAVSDCGSDVWLQAPAELLPPGEPVAGLAAEPGGDSAWVALQAQDNSAHIDRVTLSEHEGKQTAALAEQDVLGLGGQQSDVGSRGNAGPIACPAPHDCWLATDQGWLYHLSDGSPEAQDTDPSFAEVITYRPPDEGIPRLIADVPPPDDSLANQQPPPPPPPPPVQTTPTTAGPVVVHVQSHMLHRDTLVLTFTLTVEARVQLLARRRGKTVARTPRRTLKAGRVRLLLRLNPRHWPTKLDLRADPLATPPPAPAGAGESVPPPTSSESVST
jgi:hypothetical protein